MEKIYYLPTDKKIICLTFDDGPNDLVTPIILKILKQYKIKATFFVLMENVVRYPDVLKNLIADGHEVGLHGYTHKSFRKHPTLTIYRHINKAMELLKTFGVRPVYFRPPYGTFTIETEKICQEFNLAPIGFTVMEKDWQPYHPERKTICLLKKCSPGKIIVLHDGYRNYKPDGTTVEKLSQSIPVLLSRGYSFVSIPELISAKSTAPCKIFNNVPLLHHEIIHYENYNQTMLHFYWDVSTLEPNIEHACPTCGTKIENKKFEIQIGPPNNTHLVRDYPDSTAMESWHKGMEFPLNFVNEHTPIYIKDKNTFIKI